MSKKVTFQDQNKAGKAQTKAPQQVEEVGGGDGSMANAAGDQHKHDYVAKLKKQSEELDRQKKRVQELNDESEKYKKEVRKLQEEMENKVPSLEKSVKTLQERLTRAQKQLSDDSASNLMALQKAKSESAEAQKRADEAESGRVARERAVKQAERNNKLLQEEIEKLKLQQKDIQNQAENLKREVRDREKDVKDVKTKLLEEEKKWESVKKDEVRLKTLEDTRNELIRENDRLAGELENRTQQLNFKLETWIEKAQTYKTELDQFKNENKHLEHNMRIEREKKDEYKVQLNSIKNQLKEFDELQRKLRQRDKYCEELEQQVDDLKRTIRKNPGQLMMDYDVQNTQELVFRLQNDVRLLQMEADTRRQESDQWRARALELEELMQGRKHFDEERVYLEGQIRERDEIIRNLKERLDIAQRELQTLVRRQSNNPAAYGISAYQYY